eukprot:m.591905 g.591905  ORF g.591905 m.591905 type:complete len:435 (+) comp22388_c0_seq1:541-1845(+)
MVLMDSVRDGKRMCTPGFRTLQTSLVRNIICVAAIVLLVRWLLFGPQARPIDPADIREVCASRLNTRSMQGFKDDVETVADDEESGFLHRTSLSSMDLYAMAVNAESALLTRAGSVRLASARRGLNATDRRIPRTVYQTYWRIPTHKDGYTTAADAVDSWQDRGWEYKFFNDTDAVGFIEQNFQRWVVDAYHALVPHAFKADFFRYCLIYLQGGLYVDIDVVLYFNGSLDALVPPATGLWTPTQPSNIVCGLWNGILGATPGHPALALSALQAALHVKHRMTPVDLQATFCPDVSPNGLIRELHLFLTGPDLLGHVVSMVATGTPCHAFAVGVLNVTTPSTPMRRLLHHAGTIELLLQRPMEMYRADNLDHPVMGTPPMRDLNMHSGPGRMSYRWLWETQRAYSDTGRTARLLAGPVERVYKALQFYVFSSRAM